MKALLTDIMFVFFFWGTLYVIRFYFGFSKRPALRDKLNAVQMLEYLVI